MIREHPRFQKTAIIFVSAIQLTDIDRLRGYEMGAVDYVPVPVVPEVLRAKVRVFAELYRKTRQLERLNAELEQRVAERTAELEASTARLLRKRGAPQPGARGRQMGSWDWDLQHRRMRLGRRPVPHLRRRPGGTSRSRPRTSRALIHPDDWQRLQERLSIACCSDRQPIRPSSACGGPNGEVRWCIGTAAPSVDAAGRGRARSAASRRHHRPQGGRGAPGAAGARGRPSRQERAGARAVDRPPDAGDDHRGLYRGGRRAASGRCRARTRCCRKSRWQGADLGGWSTRSWRPTAPAAPRTIDVSGPNVLLQPDDGADARAGVARAGHQRREVRRAVVAHRRA